MIDDFVMSVEDLLTESKATSSVKLAIVRLSDGDQPYIDCTAKDPEH